MLAYVCRHVEYMSPILPYPNTVLQYTTMLAYVCRLVEYMSAILPYPSTVLQYKTMLAYACRLIEYMPLIVHMFHTCLMSAGRNIPPPYLPIMESAPKSLVK